MSNDTPESVALITEDDNKKTETELEAVISYGFMSDGTLAILNQVTVEGQEYSLPDNLFQLLSSISEINDILQLKDRLFGILPEILAELNKSE